MLKASPHAWVAALPLIVDARIVSPAGAIALPRSATGTAAGYEPFAATRMAEGDVGALRLYRRQQDGRRALVGCLPPDERRR